MTVPANFESVYNGLQTLQQKDEIWEVNSLIWIVP